MKKKKFTRHEGLVLVPFVCLRNKRISHHTVDSQGILQCAVFVRRQLAGGLVKKNTFPPLFVMVVQTKRTSRVLEQVTVVTRHGDRAPLHIPQGPRRNLSSVRWSCADAMMVSQGGEAFPSLVLSKRIMASIEVYFHLLLFSLP